MENENRKEMMKAVEKEFRDLKREVKVGAVDGKGTKEIEIEGRRFNVMGAEYWCAGLLEKLEKIVGQGAAGILYRSGFEIGKEHFDFMDGSYEGSDYKLLGKYLGFLKFCGYGEISVDYRDDCMFLKVHDSPDAEEWMDMHDEERKVCHYLRGLFAGFLSSLKKVDVRVDETQCRAEGFENCLFRTEIEEG